MVAVRANHLECVHLLLDEGANVNPVNGRDSRYMRLFGSQCFNFS